MKWADTCVLALPCGRSAHLEAGWMSGAGKKLIVYMPPATKVCSECKGTGTVPDPYGPTEFDCHACDDGYITLWNFEPELMYLIGGDPSLLCFNHDELLTRLKEDTHVP